MWALQTLADAVTLAVRRPVVLMPLLVLGLLLTALGLDSALLLKSPPPSFREKTLDLGEIGLPLILGVFLAYTYLWSVVFISPSLALPSLALVLFFFIDFLAYLWSVAATTLLVGQAERGEAPALGVALRRGLNNLLPLFFLFIVLAVISFIAVGIPFRIIGLIVEMDDLFSIIAGVIAGQVHISSLRIEEALIFFLFIPLLVLWGLFLGVKFILAKAAVVLGGFGPIEAVGESWDLTKGAFWRLVGLVILIALGSALLDFALTRIPTVGSLLSFVLVSYVWIAAFALAYLRLKRPIER
jgi:hypothetical protein